MRVSSSNLNNFRNGGYVGRVTNKEHIVSWRTRVTIRAAGNIETCGGFRKTQRQNPLVLIECMCDCGQTNNPDIVNAVDIGGFHKKWLNIRYTGRNGRYGRPGSLEEIRW